MLPEVSWGGQFPSPPLMRQFLIYSGINQFLSGFPETLIEFCEANKLSRTELSKDMNYLPFPYAEIPNAFRRNSYHSRTR